MESKNKKFTGKRRTQFVFLLFCDALIINASYLIALWIRFDCHYSKIPEEYLTACYKCIPVYTLFTLIVYWFCKMYRSVWKFAGVIELRYIVKSSLISNIVYFVYITCVHRRMPLTYYIMGWLLQIILIATIRYSYRLLFLASRGRSKKDSQNRVMIIGGGNAGRMLIKDMKIAREFKDCPICIIDDDPDKWGLMLEGVLIVGGRDRIMESAKNYDINRIYLAIPSATAEQRRDLLNICKETGCELKNLPGIYQIANGEVTMSRLKNVSIDDLLGREPIRTDMKEVFDFINGKVVLVTGGGGSIGSELCRQIARHSPKQLIIFDIYENNAYDIQMELSEELPDLDLVTLIGSVRDSRRIFDVFETYHPQIVYHAAAHKHVPLMEGSPNEAIKNNVIGTYKTAYAAMANHAERFVLISTDKAVNPTNVMGASKRLCEMVIQSFDAKIKEGHPEEIPELFTHQDEDAVGESSAKKIFKDVRTEFVAVRFGNVLGSNGSVVPLFKKWIEKGEPLRVTHPDIIRYFMTIPEAASLVLLAGTYAKGGEIFVLDMGSPVKIDDLARNMIRLSGWSRMST